MQGDDGHTYGVISFQEARRIAEEKGLDLLEVSPNATPPVVKLIDYGKYKYTIQKKANETKKKQVQVQLKEIQFRPNIESHDLEIKLSKVRQFLERGDKVKMVMQFRGREMAYKKAGEEKFTSIIKLLQENSNIIVESEPKFMGNRIITIIATTKKAKKGTAKVAKVAKEAKESKKSSAINGKKYLL